MSNRDLGDILDRLSIAELKTKRIGGEDNKKEFDTFLSFKEEYKQRYSTYDIEQWYSHILKINDFIWILEAGLKSGKEELANPVYLLDRRNNPVLANIGITTILIRNFNCLRVDFKNIINKIVHEGFQNYKKDHLSE